MDLFLNADMDIHDDEEYVKPEIIGPDATSSKNEIASDMADELTPKQAWCLYLSHFLFTWISRTYEYATILFIQYTFPGDLLPSSINGIAETVCVLVSSAAFGRWVDQSPSRLRPLMLSILANRSSLIVCCALWLIVFSTTHAVVHQIFFGIILCLGMVEKVSRISNMLSVERDWIPTIASYSESASSTNPTSYDLTHLNTVIRRIDIACKFLAPLAISSLMIVVEPWFAAVLVGLTGAVGCIIEIWTALFVWKSNRRLRQVKRGSLVQPYATSETATTLCFLRSTGEAFKLFLAQLEGLKYWFGTKVWIPSLGIAILHASVLAWSGTLITWLLNSGFSYAGITVAKSIGSVFEIGSTFVFPWLIAYLSKRASPGKSGGTYQMINPEDEEEDNTTDWREYGEQGPTDNLKPDESFGDLAPIVTTAQWSILSLIVCLVPTIIALFILDAKFSDQTLPPSTSATATIDSREDSATKVTVSILPAVPFLIFLSFSFLGRWTYDLSITQLTQIAIPARRRSEFGGTEMALVSLISLTHWVAAAIWHRQEDFKWLALGSVVAVAGAAGSYLYWSRNKAVRWSGGGGG